MRFADVLETAVTPEFQYGVARLDGVVVIEPVLRRTRHQGRLFRPEPDPRPLTAPPDQIGTR
jgi:hypothetical protein